MSPVTQGRLCVVGVRLGAQCRTEHMGLPPWSGECGSNSPGRESSEASGWEGYSGAHRVAWQGGAGSRADRLGTEAGRGTTGRMGL